VQKRQDTEVVVFFYHSFWVFPWWVGFGFGTGIKAGCGQLGGGILANLRKTFFIMSLLLFISCGGISVVFIYYASGRKCFDETM